MTRVLFEEVILKNLSYRIVVEADWLVEVLLPVECLRN
jgi:hypothetical protein